MLKCRNRPGFAFVLVATCIALTLSACGGGEAARSTGREKLGAADQADLDSIIRSVELTEAADTLTYSGTQMFISSDSSEQLLLLKRDGRVDLDAQLSELRTVTGKGTALTFFTTAQDVFVKSEDAQDSGPPWTRIPPEQVAAAGGPPGVALPAAEIVRAAELPGVRLAPSRNENKRYRIEVPDYDALEMVSPTIYNKLNEALGQEQVPSQFAGTTTAEVSLDAQGRWIGLEADVGHLAARAAELIPDFPYVEGTALQFVLRFSGLGEPLTLRPPGPSDVK